MRSFLRVLPVVVGTAVSVVPSVHAQSTITLFGTEYSVVRINYSDAIRVPRIIPTLPRVPFIESEGVQWIGGNKLLLSADDVNDAGGPTNENWIIEATLAEENCVITGIASFRVVLTQLVASTGYDLNPTGVTWNPSNRGLGAGGNVVVAWGDGRLLGFSADPAQQGVQLDFPVGSGCGTVGGIECSLDLTSRNNNLEDVVFAPVGDHGAFFTINQDQPTVERWDALTGAFVGEFPIGFALPGGTPLFDAKGITYSTNSDRLPAALQRPDGVLIVAFDDGFPGLQAFALDGTLLGTEVLTVDGTAGGIARLDVDGCPEQLHLESLSVDPATGRLFLSNQGSLTLCNYLWVLTPVTHSCGTCAPCAADFNQDGGVDGADVASFFPEWENSGGCADVNQDGGVDGADIEAFFLAWEAGGC
jgi:hypothetical protein